MKLPRAIRIFATGLLANILALILTALPAPGQQCPQASATGPSIASESRALEGELVFHDSIRQWFELKLDKPICEQPSIQLVLGKRDWNQLEILRGCRVRSSGAIDFSHTGYYSLNTYQSVDRIEPVRACAKQKPFPDYSKARPDKAVREYRVDMHINYGPGDHPINFRVSSAGKELLPWQAYASYMLTGGFVLYGYCSRGFVVDEVFGAPDAHPAHFTEARSSDDAAMFDPENTAEYEKNDLHLGYTCLRKP